MSDEVMMIYWEEKRRNESGESSNRIPGRTPVTSIAYRGLNQ